MPKDLLSGTPLSSYSYGASHFLGEAFLRTPDSGRDT